MDTSRLCKYTLLLLLLFCLLCRKRTVWKTKSSVSRSNITDSVQRHKPLLSAVPMPALILWQAWHLTPFTGCIWHLSTVGVTEHSWLHKLQPNKGVSIRSLVEGRKHVFLYYFCVMLPPSTAKLWHFSTISCGICKACEVDDGGYVKVCRHVGAF